MKSDLPGPVPSATHAEVAGSACLAAGPGTETTQVTLSTGRIAWLPLGTQREQVTIGWARGTETGLCQRPRQLPPLEVPGDP